MTSKHATESPSRGEVFSFGTASLEDGEARFSFTCSRFGSFTESARFGCVGTVPEGLLTLLHVALGVSTYKAAAARRVVFPPLTGAGRAMAEALYTEGLAEFFVRSGLPFPPETVFEGPVTDTGASGAPIAGRPIVAFGGGKDSYVAGAIVEKATATAPHFASVVMAEPVARVLQATAPAPLLFIERSLDPKLLALEGAFSGHVPITAINILMLTIAGYLRGEGPILFANERSADEPTMELGGVTANHQYSKSSAFEALIRDAVREAAPQAPQSFSVLRPFSELWIGRAFAALPEAFVRFTSCNRNFRLAGDADRRWCGACAKCAFTSLILAPFISAEDGQAIFGRVMLDEPGLLSVYEELCGLTVHKPWDCVGTIDECRAALFLASKTEAFAGTLAVRELLPKVLETETPGSLEGKAQRALMPGPSGALPEVFRSAALELFS